MSAPIQFRPLRVDPVVAAAAPARLRQLGARELERRADAVVYLTASGHKLRVTARGANFNFEFYPAGCAC